MPADATHRQPTALLLHTTDTGAHYDWLIGRPGEDRLWAARLGEPTARWAELGRFELEPIAPHRREYLTYEGPISGGRGSVQRVDEGSVQVRRWSDDGAQLVVSMHGFIGRLDLKRIDEGRWVAEVR